MDSYAVIETGGKQYRVSEGSVLDVEHLDGEVGDTVSLDRVLAVSDGKALQVGTPVVDGQTVDAEILEQGRGPKVIAFKKKRRKGYQRKVGHRQARTRLRVAAIKGA